MPVNLLLVEGNLDANILGAILKGTPPVEARGSKYSLKPIAVQEWKRTGQRVAFVRDRDFDFDPAPNQDHMPGEIRDGRFPEPLGWYWSRHEIENYLLDPALIALIWPSGARQDYEAALIEAALRIRFYEAARWTIGMARRTLPPHYELKTRPIELEGRELGIPSWLNQIQCGEWALGCIAEYMNRVSESLSPHTSACSLESKIAEFTEDFCANWENILVWFSGKDILYALGPALNRIYGVDAGRFRERIRDWIISNPESALDVLPEWKVLVNFLRQ
ncbi:MAG: hypothetical protein HPY52_03040 [Firmicutes bacterium]|nr:hypothetical protein [Bacillota bacterium]